MIDPSLPLELDDGTPVRFISSSDFFLLVAFDKPPTRPGVTARSRTWERKGISWSYTKDGRFAGGTKEAQYTLRNSILEPDETESFFV